LNKLQGPLTTPTPAPRPSSPPPLVVPDWANRNEPKPGYLAPPPAGPTPLVTPAAPQPTAADLILNKTNADKLAENLEKAGKPKPAAGYQPHHMVPSRDGGPAMQAIRDKLAVLDLDLNDAANGIWLPGWKSVETPGEPAYHQRLANDDYNQAIIELLEPVTTKQEAIGVLERIGARLQIQDFPGVRPRPPKEGTEP
jgi:hypothetical protein